MAQIKRGNNHMQNACQGGQFIATPRFRSNSVHVFDLLDSKWWFICYLWINSSVKYTTEGSVTCISDSYSAKVQQNEEPNCWPTRDLNLWPLCSPVNTQAILSKCALFIQTHLYCAKKPVTTMLMMAWWWWWSDDDDDLMVRH